MASFTALSSSSLSSFISLHALQPDKLVQLIIQSITFKDGEVCDGIHFVESIVEAIHICEQALQMLRSFEKTSIKKKKICQPNIKKDEVKVHLNNLRTLSRDNLFAICEYLDLSSKAYLRFTSMSVHIDMMGFPLDMGEIQQDSTVSLVPCVQLCTPMRIFKRLPLNSCGCDASQQLQLIDLGTPLKQALCSNLTNTQLLQLGIGHAWTISGVTVRLKNTYDEFMQSCAILKKHNAYQSIKRLSIDFSSVNEMIMDTLYTCELAEYVEDLTIDVLSGSVSTNVQLSALLSSFKMLRCLQIHNITIQGSLNELIQYHPPHQIEQLKLDGIKMTADMSCLASLKNLTVLELESSRRERFHGDIAAFSSLTKLKKLVLEHSALIIGNISSLSTLTRLEHLQLGGTSIEGKIESLLKKYLLKLKELNLCGNANLNGHLIFWSGNIENLTLINNDMHLDFSSLIPLKKLRHVEICGLPNVKGDISVMSSFTKLKFICLTRCDQIRGSLLSLGTLSSVKDLYLYLAELPNVTGDRELFRRSVPNAVVRVIT